MGHHQTDNGVGVPEAKSEKISERAFEEIIVEHFLNLIKYINMSIQEA